MLHSSSTDVLIRPERAAHPQAVALLEALDRSLADLYPSEANHLLSLAILETGRDQREAMGLYQRFGHQKRAALGGDPSNGLSLFLKKRL